MLLENDNFLSELTKLFQQQRVKNAGSLTLVMKRYDGRTKPKPKLTKKQRLEQKKSSTVSSPLSTTTTTHEVVEYKCLIRANYGSKKLSTIVASKDINRFQLAYANLLKNNMDTLKKKAKESKSTGQSSTNPNSNVPLSPRAQTATTAATTTAATTSSATNQQKKTPTTPAKKK